VATSATWWSSAIEQLGRREDAHAYEEADLVSIEACKQRAVEKGQDYRGRYGVE
jgi:hypothetical protein